MKNMSSWLDNARNYFSTIKTTDSYFVNETLGTIQSNLPSIFDLQRKINHLHNNYIQIQQTRINNRYISELLSRSTFIQTQFVPSPSTYATVASAYSEIMLKNFTTQSDTLLTRQVRSLLGSLFPCRNLSAALAILLNNMCNSNEILETLVNNGFVWIILSVLLVLMFHVHWALIRIEFSEKTEKNVSTC